MILKGDGMKTEDLETEVLHACMVALASLEPMEDHAQATIRIFDYLHRRFREEATKRIAELEKEKAVAEKEYLELRRQLLEADREDKEREIANHTEFVPLP